MFVRQESNQPFQKNFNSAPLALLRLPLLKRIVDLLENPDIGGSHFAGSRVLTSALPSQQRKLTCKKCVINDKSKKGPVKSRPHRDFLIDLMLIHIF